MHGCRERRWPFPPPPNLIRRRSSALLFSLFRLTSLLMSCSGEEVVTFVYFVRVFFFYNCPQMSKEDVKVYWILVDFALLGYCSSMFLLVYFLLVFEFLSRFWVLILVIW